MSINSDSAYEILTTLARAIAEDKKLRLWFHSLSQKSVVERRNEIFQMEVEIADKYKDTDLASALHLLTDARVFEAAKVAVNECK